MYTLFQLSKTLPVKQTEKLPRGWNSQTGVYCVLYQRKKSADSATYLLKLIPMEEYLLVNLMVMA